MQERKMPSIGPIEVATPIHVVYPGEVVQRFLRHHGCQIEPLNAREVRLTYPEGSMRQELLPRMLESHLRVLLSDGIELREIEPRGRACNTPLVYVVVDAHTEPELNAYLAQVNQHDNEHP